MEIIDSVEIIENQANFEKVVNENPSSAHMDYKDRANFSRSKMPKWRVFLQGTVLGNKKVGCMTFCLKVVTGCIWTETQQKNS